MTDTYRNPWFNSSGGHDPEFYTTDVKPVQVGKYLRYHRIKSSSPSGNCYDFVRDSVCVTQRAGPGLSEAELDKIYAARGAVGKSSVTNEGKS